VKHSAPLADRPLAEVAREAVERGGADGLVVSGPATGTAVDRDRLERVATVADETGVPLVVGSGVRPDTVGDLFDVADAAIVGTALKEADEVTAPVDRARVERLVAAARGE
jgi:predicted TIM-barrel enzyme